MPKELTKKQEKEIKKVEYVFGKLMESIPMSEQDLKEIENWLPYYEEQIEPLEKEE